MRHKLATGLVALSTAFLTLSPDGAWAICAPPLPELQFSYPAANTAEVPTDAVFWAVPSGGEARMWLDGVELQPLGEGAVERAQFAPPQLLSPGLHEIQISVVGVGWDVSREIERVLRVQFEALERPSFPSERAIESVTRYTSDGYTAPLYTIPSCEPLARLVDGCFDIPPQSVTQVEISRHDYRSALAYVVDDVIVPTHCHALALPGFPAAGVPTLRAILPNGLSPHRIFDGETIVVEDYEAPPECVEEEEVDGGFPVPIAPTPTPTPALPTPTPPPPAPRRPPITAPPPAGPPTTAPPVSVPPPISFPPYAGCSVALPAAAAASWSPVGLLAALGLIFSRRRRSGAD